MLDDGVDCFYAQISRFRNMQQSIKQLCRQYLGCFLFVIFIFRFLEIKKAPKGLFLKYNYFAAA
jgi:hypothetical protein